VTALSDALTATQARAVAALAKQYVGGVFNAEQVCAELESMGIRDAVDAGYWLNALGIIREAGGEAPAEQKPREAKPSEPASDKQWSFLRKLADEKGTTAPEGPLTKEQASTIIEQLQAGTYNADEWTVPF
jgi:hypothetical protein